MSGDFSKKEFENNDQREQRLMEALRVQVENAKAIAPYWTEQLGDVDSGLLKTRADLAKLPVVRKSELIALQEKAFLGGMAGPDCKNARHLFLSPGPLIEPEPAREADPWRMAPALVAAGIDADDIVANCFSYHITPAGIMFDKAATNIGCTIFPAGVGNVDTLIKAFNRFNISAYVGTPDFLKIIMDKALDVGQPVSSITKALVSGGPLFPSLREWYEQHNVSVLQCYGTAEVGLIAFETIEDPDGMVIAEDCIVEIVRPGTNELVRVGEVGEVVVTTFDAHYPLIRFGTGDLSALIDEPSKSGRTNQRLRGWLGRADQTTKVRGMFVHPEQVDRIVKALPDINRVRMEVRSKDGADALFILCESNSNSEQLANKIAEAVRAECNLRSNVEFVPFDSLPNDGKIIDDQRELSA